LTPSKKKFQKYHFSFCASSRAAGVYTEALAATDAVVSDAATVKAAFFAVSAAMLMKLVASQTPSIVRCSEQFVS
jgi:hypothetical protein